MKNSLFPSVREAVLVIVITAFFLILTAVCIRLRPEHFLMGGVFLLLFFAGQTTRKLAVALLPFSYSAFRMTGCAYIPITR